MGLNPNALRFLAREKKNGTRLGRTAMIGRQAIHMSASQLEQILNSEFNLELPSDKIRSAHAAGFADDLFKLLGSETIESFDYSDYEGATHVHDFNTPISEEHKGNYSFLIDGGTLEHVFQFPTALKNCMEMLEVGGTYFGVTPANNEMGHGFYQFSPELYFRAFSAQNGFRIDDVFIYEGRETPVWFGIIDPEISQRRAEKVNTKPTYMLVRATKIAEVEVFAKPPLQPDYVSAWNSSEENTPDAAETNNSSKNAKPIWRKAASLLPYRVKRAITMSRVAIRQKIGRMKVHLGANPDPEIFQRFDPRTD